MVILEALSAMSGPNNFKDMAVISACNIDFVKLLPCFNMRWQTLSINKFLLIISSTKRKNFEVATTIKY